MKCFFHMGVLYSFSAPNHLVVTQSCVTSFRYKAKRKWNGLYDDEEQGSCAKRNGKLRLRGASEKRNSTPVD